jgi:hypothetical protein
MTLATVDSNDNKANDFDKYFSNTDLFDLFEYDQDAKECDTLNMLLKRDGFPYIKTPNNDRHISYLKSLE